MFDKNNLKNFIQHAKNMQNTISKIQEKIASIEAIGTSGAGLVKVFMNGLYNCKRVKIHASLLKDNKEILEDLIAAAFNDGVQRINEIQKNNLKK